MKRSVVVSLLVALGALAPCSVARAQWNSCGVGLCTTPQDQYLPAATSDNAGGALVAWADHRDPKRWMIYAQQIDNLGFPQWASDGLRVAPDSALADSTFDQQSPAILADGAGGAFVVWVDSRENPYTDIYAQRIDASGTPQWATLNGGIGVCKAYNVQQRPVLTTDGAGGIIVAWQDCRNGINFDVYAQRLSGAGATLWPVNGVVLCNAADNQTRPQIIPDGAGGAIVAWADSRYVTPTTGNVDIYGQRVNASGAPQWSANGVPTFGFPGAAFSGEQVLPQIIADGAGGAIVTCQDSRGGSNYDIYAQHLSGAGAQMWTSSGAAVTTAANGQFNPTLCSDGAGGAIFLWQDQRKGANSDADIYVQRLNAAGAAQWTSNGVAVCTAVQNQQYPNPVPDGLGGAILLWYDERNASPNLFTQRVDATGAVQWAANGIVICGIPYGAYAHSVIADGLGGAIVAWQDGRTTNTDIYAARVSGGGSLGAPSTLLGVGDPASTGLRLAAPRPNPTRQSLSVSFVLPAAGPATLELLDVSGRLVERREVGNLGSGAHVVQLGRDLRLKAGLYFVRLEQNGRSVIAKASVVP